MLTSGQTPPIDSMPPGTMGQEDAAVKKERLLSAMTTILQDLEKLADDQVMRKKQVEDRWLADLRQFHGRYDTDTENNLKNTKKSRLFLNLTRPKTNGWIARVSDLLFPTDEKNWGIKATPNPELATAVEKGAPELPPPVVTGAPEGAQAMPAPGQAQPAANAKMPEQLPYMPAGEPPSPEEAEVRIAAAGADAIQKSATLKAAAMEREIDDQFRGTRYNEKARLAIDDMCKLGTAIMKGPVKETLIRKSWSRVSPGFDQATQQMLPEQWGMREVKTIRPCFERVNPWFYFPDMAARDVESKMFDFELHLFNKKQIAELAKRPGFIKDQVKELAKDEPSRQLPHFLTTLRELTDGDQASMKDMYWVWEYNGPIKSGDLRQLAEHFDDGLMLDVSDEVDDPTDVVNCVVWFCQGKLLKFAPAMMDSGEGIYSICQLEKDETSIFGFGVPYLMRNPQTAANAAWRMLLNNAGLSVGPQVVINRDVVEPVDGSWEIVGQKVWTRKGTLTNTGPVFEIFSIPSGQQELSNIVAMARQFSDEEAQLPMIAQGEPGAHPKVGGGGGAEKTASGLTTLMNSVNVGFRRVIKQFDDGITTPNVRRAYDWNMQFSEKEDIKGDFDVDARGSSVLLVREIQAANFMTIAMQFSTHPIFGPMTDTRTLYRSLMRANLISSDEVVLPDSKIDENLQKMAEQEQKNPEQTTASIVAAKLNQEMEIARMIAAKDIELANLQRETEMMKMAATLNMSLDKVQAQLTQIRSKERLGAAEMALARRKGEGI